MAEVLCPLLPDTPNLSQIQPQHSPTIDADMSQFNQHSRTRSNYTNNNNGGGSGFMSNAPAPTYAFAATPHLRTDSRSSVAGAQSNARPFSSSESASAANRQRYPAPNSSVSTTSSSSSSAPSWSQTFLAKDDSVLNSSFSIPPFTTPSLTSVDSTPSTKTSATTSSDQTAKPSPNRYHRAGKKSETSAPTVQSVTGVSDAHTSTEDSQMEASSPSTATAVVPAAAGQTEPDRTATATATANGVAEGPNLDDFPTLQSAGSTAFKRYKRRSSMGVSPVTSPAAEVAPNVVSSQTNTMQTRPVSSQSNQRILTPTTKIDPPTGPARTFADVARRTNVPSPLSRPPVQSAGQPNHNASNNIYQNSPAVAAMAALSEKDAQRGVKSKFRRAFSFGSSAEMRRVGEGDGAVERAKLRKEQFSNELDEEQEAIAKQQTEAGLGNNIYSGQGGFTGSTDNLSISSTASSASLMLRKMGRGMKKGGRSIKGLFRPKSVIGVPPADGPAEISFVTVEAERERVNVNVDPKDQAGGGTSFPKLDRNSIDTNHMAQPADHEPRPESRKSIMGGETDRQEVLAAVRRGILKRAATGSPAQSPAVANPEAPPSRRSNTSFDRHASPSPSEVSNDQKQTVAHRRTDSVTLDNNDYFASMPPRHPNTSSRSLPGTPRGLSRNISFSPRIQFHDVWSSQDYDRRGDIATCNRLTPMLAQQIKEELNTFKMEMEVHELSKPHTHFF